MWFEGKMTVFGGCFREWKCSRTDTSWSFSKYLMPFFAKDNQIAICNLTVAMDSVFSFKNPFYHSWMWFVGKMTGFFFAAFWEKRCYCMDKSCSISKYVWTSTHTRCGFPALP